MSFPRYPTYKPSGVEWLGEVPEHWGAIEARREIAFLTSGSRGWADYYSDEGPIFLRIGNLTRDSIRLNLEDIQRVTPPAGVEGDRTEVNEGDVLFSITAYLGSVAVVPGGLERAYVSQHVCLARLANGNLMPDWLAYSVLSASGKAYLEAESYGGTKVQLALDDVKSFPLTLPPIKEQRSLITFLDHETAKIDTLIAEQQRLIELLQEKRQAVISHAVTKGLNPDAPMKDSGVEWLGEVPEHWRNYRLKALFALKHGYAFDGGQFSDEGEYALITPGNFNETGGFRRKNPEKYYVGSDIPSEFILQGGEMLIAMTEQAPRLVGTALIVPEGEYYLHNQRLGLVTRLKAGELDTSFLYWLMNSPVLKAKVGVTAAGQKVRHTSPQKILDNEICLPPLNEQNDIAQALFEADEISIKLTEDSDSSIRLLVERRSALISAAVTGQIDVRGLVPEAVAA
jgi:type I restriction enzyme S subunit